MNRYIFLTPTICNIGGAQLYVANKAKWLTCKGWDVVVMSYLRDDVTINILKPYQKYINEKLFLRLNYLSTEDKNDIIATLDNGMYDNIIIESHTPNLNVIGEFIASQLNAVNFCYLLTELFPSLSSDERAFYSFKLDQNLLYGITKESIPLLLNVTDRAYERELFAVGVSQNLLSESNHPLIKELDNGKKTIITIGRINKPFVPYMVDEIVLFAKKHPDDSFNVVFIGDTTDVKYKESLFDKLRKTPNIQLFCTGYLAPIPRSLIRTADVIIASSGSACLGIEDRILTIVIDAKDFEPIGILGITTKNLLFRETEPIIKTSILLEEVLYGNLYSPESIDFELTNSDYSEHEKILNYCINLKETKYFEFSIENNMKNRIASLIYRIFGLHVYRKMVSLLMK